MASSVITRSSSSKRKGNNQNLLVSDKPLDKYFKKSTEPAAGSTLDRTTSDIEEQSNMEDRIMKALEAQTEVIRNEIKQVKESFEQKIFDLDTKQKDYESRLDSVEKSLVFAHNQIDQLQKDLSNKDHNLINIEKKLNNSEAENMTKTLEIQKLKEQLNAQERYQRGWNFRVVGVPEKGRGKENCAQIVQDIIMENKLFTNVDNKSAVAKLIENAHRSGKPGNKPRHIIVKMFSRPIRREIMIRSKENLKDKNYHLIDDLTYSDYQLKKKAKDQMDEAYRNGKKSRFANGKLFIDSKEIQIRNA